MVPALEESWQEGDKLSAIAAAGLRPLLDRNSNCEYGTLKVSLPPLPPNNRIPVKSTRTPDVDQRAVPTVVVRRERWR